MIDLKQRAEAVKARIDCRDVVESLWGTPKHRQQKYSQYFSRWRDDGSKGSFTVYRTSFRDYGGSGDHGDIISFVEREKNLSFEAALEWCEHFAGQRPETDPVPYKDAKSARQTGTSEPPPIEWQKSALAILKDSQDYLWSGNPDALRALDYLHEQVLIDDTLRAFGIGFNPKYRKFEGGDLPAGIVIPVMAAGALWRLSVRTNKPGRKYQNATGSKLSGLFNADAIIPGQPVLILEGEKDAMVTQQALGNLATVVTSGGVSSNLASRWCTALKTASQVYVSLDNDEPGRQATPKLLETLAGWGIEARAITIPTGKDATEYAAEHGGDLRAWFIEATRPSSNIITFEPEKPNPAKSTLSRANSDSWFIGKHDELPISVSSILRRFAPNGSAVIVRILNQAHYRGLLPGQFTRDELLQIAYDMDYKLSRATFNTYMRELEQEQERTGKGVFFWILGSVYKNIHTPTKNEINSQKRGRPSQIYQLVPQEEQLQALVDYAHYRLWEWAFPLEDHPDHDAVLSPMHRDMVDVLDTIEDRDALALELDEQIAPIAQGQGDQLSKANLKFRKSLNKVIQSLSDETVLELPRGDDWDISDVSDFIVAFAHSYAKTIEGQPFTYSQWAELLGISESSVPKYLKRASVVKTDTPNRQFVPIKNPHRVVMEVQESARQARGCPLYLIAHDQAGKQMSTAPYQEQSAPRIAAYWVKQGYTMQVVVQIANSYKIASEKPVEITPTAPAAKSVFDVSREPRDPDFEVLRPYRGRGFNPLYVARYLRGVLEKQGRWLDKWRFIDQYGEIVETKDPRELAELIINRQITSNQTRRAIESEMLAAGWRKVSA